MIFSISEDYHNESKKRNKETHINVHNISENVQASSNSSRQSSISVVTIIDLLVTLEILIMISLSLYFASLIRCI